MCPSIFTFEKHRLSVRKKTTYFLILLLFLIIVLHRDLKLEHAIVSSEGHIRLVDYGLGRFLRTPDEKCFTCCGTLSYMAPEVRQCQTNRRGNGYSFPVDYWALGIMMVQMLVGEQLDFLPSLISNFTKNPDDGSSIVDQLELPAYRSAVAKSFIAGLLEINPEKRLGSPNSPHGPIRDHQFFKWRHQIAWQDVDEGVTKPIDKIPLVKLQSIRSSISFHRFHLANNVIIRNIGRSIDLFFGIGPRLSRSRRMGRNWTISLYTNRRTFVEIIRLC